MSEQIRNRRLTKTGQRAAFGLGAKRLRHIVPLHQMRQRACFRDGERSFNDRMRPRGCKREQENAELRRSLHALVDSFLQTYIDDPLELFREIWLKGAKSQVWLLKDLCNKLRERAPQRLIERVTSR